MKKLAFVSFLLALLPMVSYAQRQYLDATITTNDGAKITGKIELNYWRISPRTFDFLGADGKKKTYTISDIAAFEATPYKGQKLIFERRAVDLEVSPYLLEELDAVPTLNYVKDTAWLQVVYQGACTLFELTDSNGKLHFFIESGEVPIVELTYKVWRSTENGNVLLKRIDLFKKQLYDFMAGCPQAQSIVTDINLGSRIRINDARKAIIKACDKYSKCQNIASVFEMKTETGTISGKLLVGAHRSSVNMAPELDQPIKGVEGFHFGFDLEYFFWKTNRRISLQNQILTYYEQKTNSIIVGQTAPYKSEIKYGAWELLVNNMATIRISNSGLSPTLKLGVAHRITFNPKVDWKYGSVNYFDTVKTRDYSFAKKPYELGPVVGLSIEYHRIGLTLDYSVTNKLPKLAFNEQASTKMLGLHGTYRLF